MFLLLFGGLPKLNANILRIQAAVFEFARLERCTFFVQIVFRENDDDALWQTCSTPTTLSSLGNQVPNIKPSVELAERDAAVQLSCSRAESKDCMHPIGLFDMLTALQVHIAHFELCVGSRAVE